MNEEFIKLTESIWLDYVELLNKLYKLVDNHHKYDECLKSLVYKYVESTIK